MPILQAHGIIFRFLSSTTSYTFSEIHELRDSGPHKTSGEAFLNG
jgi:hypothetical protein